MTGATAGGKKMNKASSHGKIQRMAGMSIFIAIIVVLTILCTFVRFGPFSITLALAPIIIGAALYGPGAGAILGGVFGFVVLLTGVFGWDGGTVMYLMSLNALGCVLICIGKGAAAGWISGLVYRLIAKKNIHLGVVVAAIVCPIVNTGIFIIGMMLFYMSTLESWAGGQAVIYYAIFGLTGVNFLVELAVNLVLSSGITSIIRYGQGRRKV